MGRRTNKDLRVKLVVVAGRTTSGSSSSDGCDGDTDGSGRGGTCGPEARVSLHELEGLVVVGVPERDDKGVFARRRRTPLPSVSQPSVLGVVAAAAGSEAEDSVESIAVCIQLDGME